jgi:phage terminase large subunit-like protein
VKTQGKHVAAFAEAYCRHTKGRWAGQPVVFEPWQQEFIDAAFELDEHGRRKVTTALLGVPRKNGKSVLAATLALYMAGADGEAGAEVVLAAGSRDQAAMVFDQARAFVDTNPELGAYFDAQRFVINGPNSSVIKRIAADGRLAHGLNSSTVIVDEAHSLTTPRQEEMWNALTTGSGAREQPLILAITTSGYDKSTVLGRLYDSGLRLDDVERRPGLTIARDPESGFLMWWYGLREDADADDEDAWMTCNPASWITPEVLRTQWESPTVDELAFRRLHLNMWTKTRDAWLPAGLWDSLRSDAELDPVLPVVIGVDVGLVHDSTAVVIAQLQEDGRIVVRSRVWAARDDAVADVIVPGGRVDLELIETYIEHLASEYQVRELVYDPRFFERSAQKLSSLGFVVAPVDQSSRRMLEAYADFYLACQEERITHNGDRVLSQHVESTMATMTEKGWKISRQRLQRIDACVATAMAVWRARLDLETDYVMSWDEVGG